jgi:uncharacterized membrane protein YebE (DUF533 family)
MIDAKRLLEQVLGSGVMQEAARKSTDLGGRLDAMSGSQGFAGGAVAGGLLGLMLGGKKFRKLTGGAAGYGGAAVLGALALQAYQHYQRQQAGGFAMPASFPGSADLPHALAGADDRPFELALVRAMVGAAKADGHIDAAEQRRLFAEVERMALDAEAKAYVFDLLTKDVDLASLADAVRTPEQGAELYLAARLAIDPDDPAERAYLDALAARLQIPGELRASLEQAAPEARVR